MTRFPVILLAITILLCTASVVAQTLPDPDDGETLELREPAKRPPTNNLGFYLFTGGHNDPGGNSTLLALGSHARLDLFSFANRTRSVFLRASGEYGFRKLERRYSTMGSLSAGIGAFIIPQMYFVASYGRMFLEESDPVMMLSIGSARTGFIFELDLTFYANSRTEFLPGSPSSTRDIGRPFAFGLRLGYSFDL